MRTDIAINYDTGELTLKKNIPQFTVDFSWLEEKEDDYYVYGECAFRYGMTEEHLYNGIGVNIPFKSKYKKIRLSFLVIDNQNNTYPVLNSSNSRAIFDVINQDNTPIYASQLPLLSEDFMYKLTMKDNMVYISDMYSYDLSINESIEQNKMFLLKCNEGNLYNYPTSGVGLPSYLNGNIGASDLGERVKDEFNRDSMYVEAASINTETGEISIKAIEK